MYTFDKHYVDDVATCTLDKNYAQVRNALNAVIAFVFARAAALQFS